MDRLRVLRAIGKLDLISTITGTYVGTERPSPEYVKRAYDEAVMELCHAIGLGTVSDREYCDALAFSVRFVEGLAELTKIAEMSKLEGTDAVYN